MDEPRNPDAYPEGIQFTDDAVRLLGESRSESERLRHTFIGPSTLLRWTVH